MAQAMLLDSQNESRDELSRKEFQEAFNFDPDPWGLDAVTSSRGFSPQKVVVYGIPGVGKTTFASTWPKPILLRTEDGAGALDIPTFPQVAHSIEDVRKAMNALLQGNHPFRTLIVDSLDWLEPIVWEEVCREGGKRNIEDFGYGKGYVRVDEKWQRIQAGMDKLRESKCMHIVCIAHASAETFDPPDADPYQRYSIKLHKRARALWTEWSEMLLFLNYKAKVVQAEGAAKAKAYGSGERIIYTMERPAYQAKSRWPLPEEIFIGHDPSWTAFHDALKEASAGEYDHD